MLNSACATQEYKRRIEPRIHGVAQSNYHSIAKGSEIKPRKELSCLLEIIETLKTRTRLATALFEDYRVRLGVGVSFAESQARSSH